MRSLYLAWLIVLVASLGSLFFSDVMGYVPCSLCWYQRVFMYPLVILLGIGILKNETLIRSYSLPIAVIGWFIAFYHNLLHWKIIPESVAPCKQGIPCSTVYVKWLGFITIPLMSLVAFTLIILLLYKLKSKRSFVDG